MKASSLGGPKPQFIDANGNPYSGAKLFWYAAGSSTKQNTYRDSTGATPNANPIVLDSSGRPTYEIWFTDGLTYKAVLAPSTDSDPPNSPIFTVDNLTGINDISGSVDEWQASGLTPTYVGATSFSVSGDQTATFTAGRRLKSTNTAGTIYSTVASSSYNGGTLVTTVVVVNDSGTLDSGLSAVSLSILRSSYSSLPWTKTSATGLTITVDPATSRVHAAQYAQVQNGASQLIGTVAGTNTITGVLTPTLTAYTAGQTFRFIPAATNTGATTINIDSLGAKNVYYRGAALGGGEIKSGVVAQVTYDGTQFNLVDSNGVFPAGTASAPSIAAAGDANTGIYFPAADTVAVTTGGTERVRVDSAGNLGLGVTPNNAYASSKALQLGAGGLISVGTTELDYVQNTYLDAAGTWTYSSTSTAARYMQQSGAHTWYTAPSGTAGNAITFTTAMTLAANGQLTVKGTSTAGAFNLDTTGAGNVEVNLKNNGTLQWSLWNDNGASNRFQITDADYSAGVTLSQNATSWGAYSDERAKDIIEPITGAVERLSAWRTVIGKYKTDADGMRRPFLIAQDVQANRPEAIDDTDPEKLQLRYTETIPDIVAAIKELTAELSAVRAEFDAYKAAHP